MKAKHTIFFAILALSLTTSAQNYSYVLDPDLYVNVRQGAGVHFPVADTIYNLQIVKHIPSPAVNGWMQIEYNNDAYIGFVHRSRLQPLPEKYTQTLDSLWTPSLFIAGVDCPQIIAFISVYEKEIIKEKYGAVPSLINLALEDLLIMNLETGSIIDDYDIIAPVNARLYGERMLFYNGNYEFSFYRNRDKKTCRGLTLLDGFYTAVTDRDGLNKVVSTSIKAIAEARTATKGLSEEDTIIVFRNILEQYISVNNFDFLSMLEQAVFSGNKEAESIYNDILYYFPIDGAGTHEIEFYFLRLKGYKNYGETIIE